MEPLNWICNAEPVSRVWNRDAWDGIKGKRGKLILVNHEPRHMLLTDGGSHLVEWEGDPQGRQWWMHPDEMTPA